MEDIADNETPGPGVVRRPADAGALIAWLERLRYGVAIVRVAVRDMAVTILIGLAVVAVVLFMMHAGQAALLALAWLMRRIAR
jgi:hypothetical protein